MEVYQIIQKLRLVKGYTQEYMAQNLGITQKQYSNMEKGTSAINEERKVKLAKLLEVEVADLEGLAKDGFNFNHCKINQGGLNINAPQDNTLLDIMAKRMEFLETQLHHLQVQLKEKDEFLREIISHRVTLS